MQNTNTKACCFHTGNQCQHAHRHKRLLHIHTHQHNTINYPHTFTNACCLYTSIQLNRIKWHAHIYNSGSGSRTHTYIAARSQMTSPPARSISLFCPFLMYGIYLLSLSNWLAVPSGPGIAVYVCVGVATRVAHL